jgi:uncharacterized protein YndB with AHSA1/START domain
MKKLIFIFLSVAIALAGKAQNSPAIHWPEEYEPSKSNFYVHNEIEINAPPAVVWEILMEAENWPKWYEGATNVSVSTESRLLEGNSSFKWKTMGIKFESVIKELVPNERLSWESKLKKIQGYHAWLIIPTATGCRVITDESQNGWLTFFEQLFQPKKLHRLHDIWLTELKRKAETKTVTNS